MSATIATVFDTQVAERTEGIGGVITGTIQITNGTVDGDRWAEIETKFKKVWGVVFGHTRNTDVSPVRAFLQYDRSTGKVTIDCTGTLTIPAIFFIARGQI